MVANRKRSTQQSKATVSPLQWLGLQRGATGVLLVLLCAVMGSGLSVVFQGYQSRNLFNELQQLRDQANELEVQWGQLLIEQSTFGVEGRIEQKASELLELQIPQVEHIVMVHDD